MKLNVLILLIVLIVGLIAGFSVGAYRGRADREALQAAVEAGKKALEAKQALEEKMNFDLGAIQRDANEKLAANQLAFDTATTQWKQERDQLQSVIDTQTAKIGANNLKLTRLGEAVSGVSGEERLRLQAEIKALTNENRELAAQRDGNICLQTPVPQSVFRSLGLGT